MMSAPPEDSHLRAERLRHFAEDTGGINDRLLTIANASSDVDGAAS